MRIDPLAMADLHLDLLYERNESGRLLRSRDPALAAPYFHLVRTVHGNRWLLSATLTDLQRERLQEALASEPVIAQLVQMEHRPPSVDGAAAFLEGERSALNEYRGPAFVFGGTVAPKVGAAEILPETGDVATVPDLAWLRTLTLVHQPVAVARNSAGQVVTVCYSTRSTAEAAEAGVETAREHRGRGLAGAVVLTWAAAVRAEGRLPLYSTQWTNLASRAVARKLELAQFGEDFHLG